MIKNIKNNTYYPIIKTTGLLLLLLLFSSLIAAIFGINYNELSDNKKIMFLLITDVIYLLFLIFCYYKTIKEDLKNYIKNFNTMFEESFKYWLTGLIGMVISNLLIIFLTKNNMANNEEAVRELIDLAPLFMIFNVGIYAPLTEELIFRKGFRDMFNSKWIYIIMSGVTFGALHVVSSVSNISQLLFIIPYSCLGIAFSYNYYKSNNIFSSIVMHSLHNTLAIILYFFI